MSENHQENLDHLKEETDNVVAILGGIFNENSAPGLSSDSSENSELMLTCSQGLTETLSEDEKILKFPGRYVTKVDCGFPFKISKRYARPMLSKAGNTNCNLASVRFLRSLFGVRNIKNMLLLITPVKSSLNQLNNSTAHAFMVDKQKHAGVTSVTIDEQRLIESEQSINGVYIVHCSVHIELKDVYWKTPIRDQLFRVLEKKPVVPVRAWYAGKKLIFTYRDHDSVALRETDVLPSGTSFKKTYSKLSLKIQPYQDIKESSEQPSSSSKKASKPKTIMYDCPDRRPLYYIRGDAGKKHKEISWEYWERIKLEADGFRVIFKRLQHRESQGAIPVTSSVSLVKFNNSTTILDAKSSVFEHLMKPVEPPKKFSIEAQGHIVKTLRTLPAKIAFEKFSTLIKRISHCPIPKNEDLLTFFKLADILSIKINVRPELIWPGRDSATTELYRVDCYMFDNRKDFIVSMSVLPKQLQYFCEIFPGIKENMRFVDDVLDLTMIPTVVARCLRKVTDTLHIRPYFNFLAEFSYEYSHPTESLLEALDLEESPST